MGGVVKTAGDTESEDVMSFFQGMLRLCALLGMVVIVVGIISLFFYLFGIAAGLESQTLRICSYIVLSTVAFLILSVGVWWTGNH
jgi:hypothetical protein